jgi:hypothetical protein
MGTDSCWASGRNVMWFRLVQKHTHAPPTWNRAHRSLHHSNSLADFFFLNYNETSLAKKACPPADTTPLSQIFFFINKLQERSAGQLLELIFTDPLWSTEQHPRTEPLTFLFSRPTHCPLPVHPDSDHPCPRIPNLCICACAHNTTHGQSYPPTTSY